MDQQEIMEKLAAFAERVDQAVSLDVYSPTFVGELQKYASAFPGIVQMPTNDTELGAVLETVQAIKSARARQTNNHTFAIADMAKRAAYGEPAPQLPYAPSAYNLDRVKQAALTSLVAATEADVILSQQNA